MTTTDDQLCLRKFGGGGRFYWVGMTRPTADQKAAGDFTLTEATFRYFTKAALVAAIANGTAFLPA